MLILIGAVLLAHNLGWLTWQWIATWWPLGLILFGLWMLVTQRPWRSEGGRRPARELQDPSHSHRPDKQP
ncbi:MAG TPA: DUF5668 domain-containing protein [Burkholderiaceae bacterium]|nr:DUF5668 domain-containing protein [Burkholderiaceae bacterium]